MVVLAGLATVAQATTVTFEDSTANPFAMTGTASVGTPGDASDKSLVLGQGDDATWTSGVEMTDVHLTARVRPSQAGTAGVILYDGPGLGWVASIGMGMASQQGTYGTEWARSMGVDGPAHNDTQTIVLSDFTSFAAASWADAWYDLAIDVVGGNVSLSLTGPGISGGLHTAYEYDLAITPVIVLSGNPAWDTDRPVLFDNITLVPEPATMAMLAVGGAAMIFGKRRPN